MARRKGFFNKKSNGIPHKDGKVVDLGGKPVGSVPPVPPLGPNTPGMVNPLKRIKVKPDEIKPLNAGAEELKLLMDQVGANRTLYLERENSLLAQKRKIQDFVNNHLDLLKKQYKAIGQAVNWDPKTNEIILK